MKRIIIATLLALACGDAPEDGITYMPGEESEYQDDDTNDDIGGLREAFTAAQGYGQKDDGSGARCPTGVHTGVCIVPTDKKVRWKFVGPNVTFSTGTDLGTLWNIASNKVCNYVNARGWDCAATTGSSNETFVETGIGGGAPANMSPFNFGSVFNTPNGQYRKFNGCVLRVSKANIEATAIWQSPNVTDSERNIFVENIIQHEEYHCLGLGHGSNGSLMDATLDFQTAMLNPVQAEGGWLQTYVP